MKIKIGTINPQLCRTISSVVEPAIKKAIEEAFENLKVVMRGGKYNDTSYTMKIEIAMVGEDGKANTTFSTDFKDMATAFGLQPSDLGRRFMFRGNIYEVSGCKPSSYKFPIIANRVCDGKSFKFSAEQVKRALGEFKG